MNYLIFALVLIITFSFLLFTYLKSKNKTIFEKIVSIIGIIVLIIRMFCYQSIISNNPSQFVGLNSSTLNNKLLTAFCLIFIWLQYSCILFVLMKPFFKIKLFNQISSFICPIVFILNLIFIQPICQILQGPKQVSPLLLMYLIEIAIGLAISLLSIIQNVKEKIKWLDVLKMIGAFCVLSIFTLPNYFLQYMFGFLKVTNTWNIVDFSPYHRYVLYGNIIIPFIIYFVLKNKSYDFQRFVLIFISLGVLMGFVINYNYTTLKTPWALPFHLCNTALFIIPLVLIFKMKRLFYFTYFINVVGALLAMLMPNYADSTNIFSMRMLTFWYNHYIAFFMPLLLVALKQFERPKIRQFIHSMGAFFVYYCLVLFLNVYFSANGHSVDYFFINSDYVADKLGNWAENIFEISYVFKIKGVEYELHPVYQLVYFVVYILIGLGVWFIYGEFYRLADGNTLLFKKIQKIKIDEYALKAALQGRKMGEPMEKDAKVKFELKHFSKRYATSKKYAVSDANLLVHGGEIFGFLGPNGAGKSTIIKSTVGIQPISEGSINICGYDVAMQSVEAKSLIGYVPDHYALYEKLTGREYINYIADIYGVSKEDREKRLEKYIHLFQLEKSIDNMIKTYSHGMKQKITIMSALIHNPKVWILDEPLTGLDPNSIYQVKECMKEHASEGNIVFFSSHLIDIVEKLCQRIAIIKGGKILCVKTLQEIEDEGYTLEEFYLKMIEE